MIVSGGFLNAGSRLVMFGGNANNGANAGLLYVNANNGLSNTNARYGALLNILPKRMNLTHWSKI